MEDKNEYCTVCHEMVSEFYNYCPMCGTRIMTVNEYQNNPYFYSKYTSSPIKDPITEVECLCGTILELRIGYNGCPNCGAVKHFDVGSYASIQRNIEQTNDGVRMKAELISQDEIDVADWIRAFKKRWKND